MRQLSQSDSDMEAMCCPTGIASLFAIRRDSIFEGTSLPIWSRKKNAINRCHDKKQNVSRLGVTLKIFGSELNTKILLILDSHTLALLTSQNIEMQHLSNLRLPLLVFVVTLESLHAADLQARLQLRRCVSLSSNMDSGEQLQHLRNTAECSAYFPAHPPVTPDARSEPVCTRRRHLIRSESAGQAPQPQRPSQEFTRIQTQLYPNIRF